MSIATPDNSHRDYRRYTVYNAEGKALSSVAAQSPEQAIYRLMGGDWGRTDYTAKEEGLSEA